MDQDSLNLLHDKNLEDVLYGERDVCSSWREVECNKHGTHHVQTAELESRAENELVFI